MSSSRHDVGDSKERKIALVTGSSSGIGRGIAQALAFDGYQVAVNYFKDEEGARETARSIEKAGGKAIIVAADVRKKSDVNRMFDKVLEELGVPYLVVNNAGVQTWKSLLELEEEEWDRTLDTNLKGSFLCIQRAAKEMIPHGRGRVVNIGSGCNKGPFPNLVEYSSSKGGLEILTRSAAVELGPYGITVNCVAPGAIEIARTREENPNYAEVWASITPVRRVGKVEDVARAVAFLASDEAEFINGQTIYVDGGLFSQLPWAYEQ
ncbi:MAG TPA: SDR family NAD(P)-dependent oxidoreductase [Acidobacteriota bacterium]|nr:SDR family NAD(P)-dependent oxidoreductase [Acidobacteriota bacterium]